MAAKTSTWYDELRKFASSGIFCILLGGVFLLLSYLQHLADGRLSTFVVLFGLLGVTIMLYGVVVQTAGAGNFYGELKKFFASGTFYILLGAAFLWISYLQIGTPSSHPTFIFLLAILGVAIVLYGTGTQAAGQSNTGTINIAIAGGAGVLALAFGYGVIEKNLDIQKVFSTARYYVVVKLEPDDNEVNFEDFAISARRSDGELLHLKKGRHQVEILVPVSNTSEKTELTVSAHKSGSRKEDLPILKQKYEITWATKRFRRPGNKKSDEKEGEIETASDHGPSVRFQITDALVIPAILVDSEQLKKLKSVTIDRGIDDGMSLEIAPQ